MYNCRPLSFYSCLQDLMNSLEQKAAFDQSTYFCLAFNKSSIQLLFCRNWSSNEASTLSHFACSLKVWQSYLLEVLQKSNSVLLSDCNITNLNIPCNHSLIATFDLIEPTRNNLKRKQKNGSIATQIFVFIFQSVFFCCLLVYRPDLGCLIQNTQTYSKS